MRSIALGLMLCVTTAVTLTAAEKQYAFSTTTKNATIQETYDYWTTSNGYVFAITSEGETYTNVSYRNGTGARLEYYKPNEDSALIADLKETTLTVTGTIKGKKQNRVYTIKNPFYVTFHIAMEEFIRSDKESLDFCVLLIFGKNAQIYDLRMTKEGTEMLTIMGTPIETIKTRVTLPDFRGAFWSSEYWFRVSDGIRVKSEEQRAASRSNLWRTQLMDER